MSVPKVFVAGKPVSLDQNHYKGSGGEGAIYAKGSSAYKIYHTPAKVIAEGKIQELSKIQRTNVLAPTKLITDVNGRGVGFVMPYVDKTEFLCKLFTKGFRDANRIDNSMICRLVGIMRETLQSIHEKGILVVDYNELNFLTNLDFDQVYHIDVDSYQTPHYPATAIMESIRDRQIKNNKWTRESDWFSFGILAFQLFMATHPYKGRHPDYGKDWQAMMNAGVSVFNKASRLPPNTQDWSVVPKGYLRWFERVFEYGERLAPPDSPDVVAEPQGPVTPQIISSTAKFDLSLVRSYDEEILAARYIDGALYVQTRTGVFADQKRLRQYAKATGYSERRLRRDICPARGAAPVLITFNSLSGTLHYESLDGQLSGQVDTDGFFVANERMYVLAPCGLVEYSFVNLGAKTIVSQAVVSQVFHNHAVFDGIVVQDILSTCRVVFPTAAGIAANIHVKELDGVRVLNGKYERGIAILLIEQGGVFKRVTLVFDKVYQHYTLREQSNVPIQEVVFTVLDKGICVAANEDAVEVFASNDTVKIVDDSPLTGTQKLMSAQNQVFMVHKNQIFKMAMQ